MRISRVKFAALMAEKDLTCKQLAELSNVSRVTISSVKGGKRCRPDTAAKLAHGLGVPVTELLEEENAR